MKTLSELLAKYKTGAIARALGISTPTVTRWKRGDTFPSSEKLEPLAEFLGVPLATLVRLARKFADERAAA